MVGYGFMGAAHSQGWRVAPRFFDLPAQLSMGVLVGRHADRVETAAEKWGWSETATDWRTLLDRDDIDIIDIVTPGRSEEHTSELQSHRSISYAVSLDRKSVV